MSATARELAVLRVAHLYFFDGLTQAAIAERLGCTRWTVGRLLQEGEDKGIVDIRILHPQARDHKLELALKEQYGLAAAQVVATREGAAETLSLVVRTAAEFLQCMRPRPRNLAFAWGRTTAAISRALADGWNPGVRVMQADMAPEEVEELLSLGPLRQVAAKAPGELLLLGGGPIVRSSRESLVATLQARESDAMRAVNMADTVVYSPGGVAESSLLVRSGHLTSKELRALWEEGGVANVACHILDKNGEVVSRALDERTLSISLDALRGARNTIAVASGPSKVEALGVVARSGLAKIVITDSASARALLEDTAT